MNSGGVGGILDSRALPDRLNIGCQICQLSFPDPGLTVATAQQRQQLHVSDRWIQAR